MAFTDGVLIFKNCQKLYLAKCVYSFHCGYLHPVPLCLSCLLEVAILSCLSKCFHAVACDGSVVLTQTHPAAPYVCRTGNITLRCQYDGVEGVLAVLWAIGTETTTANPSTIPGHTALPRTTTYQEVVVDSYTNLRERYRCTPGLANGTVLKSNAYVPQIECKQKLR